MNRRSFLAGILAAGVAPAVVRAESLMKVVARPSGVLTFGGVPIVFDGTAFIPPYGGPFIEELNGVTRRVWIPRIVDQIYRGSPTLSSIMAECDA